MRINGQNHSGRRATPRIVHEPLPFRHDYGYVGLRLVGLRNEIIYLYGACYWPMTLYCVAPPDVRKLKSKLESRRRAVEERVERKTFKTVVRQGLLYGAETWVIAESTREDIEYCGNEDFKMDAWSHQAGENKELNN